MHINAESCNIFRRPMKPVQNMLSTDNFPQHKTPIKFAAQVHLNTVSYTAVGRNLTAYIATLTFLLFFFLDVYRKAKKRLAAKFYC